MCQLSAWSDWNMLLFSLCLLCPSLLPGMDGFCILVKVCGFVIFVVCVGCKWVWGEDSVSPGRSQCLCLVTQSSFGSLALLQKLNLRIGGAVESPHSQSCGVLRNDLCLPLTRGKALFTGPLQVPQPQGSTSLGQVPLAAQAARELKHWQPRGLTFLWTVATGLLF